ncbi:hypothetical protein [Flavobacterium sp.]|uniref:hypothetical protein n=1 Tax=Flavobacterium sp. TaxID=239 RepID=UPI003D2E51A5
MKKILLSLFVLFFFHFSFSQEKTAWTNVEKPKFESLEKIRRSSLPTDYKLFQFDYQTFQSQLINVPNRDTFRGISNVIVSIPNPNGELVEYRIIEASTFDETLQSQFSKIR